MNVTERVTGTNEGIAKGLLNLSEVIGRTAAISTILDPFLGCYPKKFSQEVSLRLVLHSGHPIRLVNGSTTLDFPDGKLVGVNHGEWGGELSWQPRKAKPEVIDKENVIAILKDGDNAVAIFGLAHMGLDYGRAMSLIRKSDGTWETGRPIQFFAEPEAITAVGNRRFAVLNVGRVVVFLSDKESWDWRHANS